MPTLRGRITIAAAVACYVAARLIGATELYAVAAVAGLLPLLATGVVRWADHRLRFRRTVRPARLFAGGRLRIEAAVENPSHLPSPPLVLEDKAPPSFGGPVRFSLSSIPGGRRGRLLAERRPAHRGRFTVGPFAARLSDPFGLAAVRHVLAGSTDVIVYPPVERLEAASAAGAGGFETAVAATPLGPDAGGDEFYAVREWQSGDDLRRIHWPSVARTGRLMVRQHETRPPLRVTVYLDSRRPAVEGAAASLEWAIAAAASTIWHLAPRGYAVRLVTAEGASGPPRAGRRAAESLLERLATLDTSGGPPSAARRDLATGGAILIAILPLPARDEWPALAALHRFYGWCGAVLIDPGSFSDTPPGARAHADQRMAEAVEALTRAGWSAVAAGAPTRYRDTWTRLLAARASHPRSRSRVS